MTSTNQKCLNQLFEASFLNEYGLDPNVCIDKITSDSREVSAGSLFLARQGVNSNGADFIESAVNQGACLILSESQQTKEINATTPIIYLPNLNELLCNLFARFYEVTLNELTFIAVTGTNGKTSVAHMLAQCLQGAYVGTIGMGRLEALQEIKNTTPSLEAVMPFFGESLKQGTRSCALEISSHALTQQRLLGLPIKTAVFTNLSHDHLDYHGTMEAYAESKYELFLNYSIQNAVIAIDDKWGKALLERLSSNVSCFSYGLTSVADIYPTSMRQSMYGIKTSLTTPKGTVSFVLPLIGEFNLLNAMAVMGVLLFEGLELSTIAQKIEALSGIQGRMEVVHKSPFFIVDYAHTPDALDKALNALKPLCHGKLWCVFGCGGDRDNAKRPLMGQAVEQHADVMVITNDNPRSEPALKIIDAIISGLKSRESAVVIADRAKAIQYCVEHALPEDVVLVAGKGHEDYQIIGNETHFFSDKECIKALVQYKR